MVNNETTLDQARRHLRSYGKSEMEVRQELPDANDAYHEIQNLKMKKSADIMKMKQQIEEQYAEQIHDLEEAYAMILKLYS